MSRTTRIGTVALGTLLGLWFVLAGVQKFLTSGMFESMFGELGLPLALVPVIGVVEIVAAALVLLPRTSLYGAALIALVMLGAIGSHLASGIRPPVAAIVALVMAGGAATPEHQALWPILLPANVAARRGGLGRG